MEKETVPEQKKELSLKKYFNQFFLRVSLPEKILFSKHLSMMISAGMTEVDSVRLIRKQIKSRGFGKILDKIIEDLERGQFLSKSLKQFPTAFGQIFTNLIAIGEVSGTLSDNLNHLSEELKKSTQLRSKVKSAMIYPMVIFAATLGITAVLVFFVLPKIIPVFYSLHVELPAETKALIAITNFLLTKYLYVIAGGILFFIVLKILLKIPRIHFLSDRFILWLPFVGKIATNYNMANITRSLGIFLKSGTKIIEAVLLVGDSVTNDVYHKAMRETAEEIKKGNPLHKYLEEHPSIFPSTVTRMIEVGENTGKLDDNLFYLAEFYENEVDETTKNLSSIMEPLILVVMGVMVGFVVISIIKPIYGVSQGLH